jgi:ankyrin repeat protein
MHSRRTRRQKGGNMRLLKALRDGEDNINIINQILNGSGVNVNKTDDYGRTPLYYAVSHGYTDIVRLLLEKGANINKAEYEGETPLYLACYEANVDIVRLLLEKGANINKANIYGYTPLYAACYNDDEDNIEIVRLLLEKGADINKANQYGETPLYIASEKGNEEIVRLLLEKGANINKATDNGSTPLYIASEEGNEEIVRLLLEKGAIIDDNILNNINNFTLEIQEIINEMTTPKNIPTRNIKRGTENVIMGDEIKNGNIMVNFPRNNKYESEYNAYYKKNTYNALNPKKNPITRAPINISKTILYKAKLVDGGGKGKKTRKMRR